MSVALQRKILSYLQQLNSFQQSEVADFIKFLTAYKQRVTPSITFIETLKGKYIHRLSNSEEFARSKNAEIQKEQAKWRTK